MRSTDTKLLNSCQSAVSQLVGGPYLPYWIEVKGRGGGVSGWGGGVSLITVIINDGVV